MGEGVVVHGAPVAADECGDEEEECRLGLMEVGDDAGDDAVAVAGGYDDAGGGDEGGGAAVAQVGGDGIEGLPDGELRVGVAVGVPLGKLAVPPTLMNHASDVVEALEGAHGGGAHGDDTAGGVGKLLDEGQRHGDELAVHLVLPYRVRFDGLERACADVERQLAARDATAGYLIEHAGGEVQPGCGGGDGAVDV